MRRDQDRRIQAELVTGCLEDHIVAGVEPNIEHLVRLDLINASRGVVYDVFLRVTGEPEDLVSVGGAARNHRETWAYMHVLAPRTCTVTLRIPEITARVMGLEIYFRDARNQRWRRDTAGMLQPAEGDPLEIKREAFWKVTSLPSQPPVQIVGPDT